MRLRAGRGGAPGKRERGSGAARSFSSHSVGAAARQAVSQLVRQTARPLPRQPACFRSNWPAKQPVRSRSSQSAPAISSEPAGPLPQQPARSLSIQLANWPTPSTARPPPQQPAGPLPQQPSRSAAASQPAGPLVRRQALFRSNPPEAAGRGSRVMESARAFSAPFSAPWRCHISC